MTRICVAVYEGKHGTETRAFDSEDGAEMWRTAIGKENWETQFPGKDQPGPDLIADEYFALMTELRDFDESFSTEMIELESATSDAGQPSLTVPTVHLNGTSREELLRQVQDAGQAVWQALDALAKASPNSRDYYPQGVAAYSAACGEHERRCRALRTVYHELTQVSEAISGP